MFSADKIDGTQTGQIESDLIHLELKTINFCQALDSETSAKNSYLIPSPQPAVRVLYLVRVFQSAFYT